MKIRLNPAIVKANGGKFRAKLGGKTYDQDEVLEMKADEFKAHKNSDATIAGARIPVWVEVKAATKTSEGE